VNRKVESNLEELVPRLSELCKALEHIVDENLWDEFIDENPRTAKLAFLGRGVAKDLILPSNQLAGDILSICGEVIPWATTNM
jgi:hypothetical protein